MRLQAVGGGLVALLLAAVIANGGGAADAKPDGKAVFLDQKCNLCHAVASAGIEAKIKSEAKRGPDLGAVKLPTDDDAVLARFLHEEAEIDGQKHKKAFKGSDEELAALLAWLREIAPKS